MPDCPPRTTLEQFLAGGLDDRAEEDVCAHVEECLACQGQLDELVARPAPRPGAIASRLELDPTFLKHLMDFDRQNR